MQLTVLNYITCFIIDFLNGIFDVNTVTVLFVWISFFSSVFKFALSPVTMWDRMAAVVCCMDFFPGWIFCYSHCCFSVYMSHLCCPAEVTCVALLFVQSLLSVPLLQHLVLFMFVVCFELSFSLFFYLRKSLVLFCFHYCPQSPWPYSQVGFYAVLEARMFSSFFCYRGSLGS